MDHKNESIIERIERDKIKWQVESLIQAHNLKVGLEVSLNGGMEGSKLALGEARMKTKCLIFA